MFWRLLGISAVGLVLISLAWRLSGPERSATQQQTARLVENSALAQAPANPASQAAATADPETFRRDYMAQCAGDRAALRPICECTYRRITTNYTYQQYLVFTNRLQTEGRIPLEIAQINQACVSAVSQES